MEGQRSTGLSHSRCASRGREKRKKSIEDGKRLPQKMACDPWPVTKYGCKNDTVLEAALVLVRARNTELIPACSNEIILLPASGAVPGIQGGSRERPLYSLRPPRLEPFKIHLWQIPANRTWNRTTWSWNVTPGKIMVRRGQKSEPLTQFLKTLGVAKGEAMISDLCNHFQCWRFLKTGDEWLDEFPWHLRGVVYQRWWSFNGFRFLQLPPELREMILTFAMGPIAVPFARRWYLKRRHQLPMPNMRLSLVSKQLNREVNATVLFHTTFYFHTLKQFLKFFQHKGEGSRVIFRPIKGFRSVELDLSPDCLFRVFGVSFIPGVFSVQDVRYERSLDLDLGLFYDNDSPLCHRICINIPHVFQHCPRPDHICCQKLHNLAFWAGARARLRNIAVVELVGHIDETQKKEWLAEHALERKGVIPEEKDFAGWQRGIWTQCSESVCECSPKCHTQRF